MTVKEWLYRPENLNRKIDAAQIAAEEAYYGCIGTTPSYSGDIVSGTKNPHAKYDRYIEARDNVNVLIDKLIDTKREMRVVIGGIKDERCRALLNCKFVDCKPWNVVAMACKCSISHAKHDLLEKSTQYLVEALDNTHNIW